MSKCLVAPPSLSDDLASGHSSECRDLALYEYRDLFSVIKKCAREAKAALTTPEVRSGDANLASCAWVYTNINSLSFGGLLDDQLLPFQAILQRSTLPPEIKEAIWRPIAECYAQVVGILSERIPPLKERKLLNPGDIFNEQVFFSLDPSHRSLTAGVKLPPFKYAVSHHAPGIDGQVNRQPLSTICFSQDHVTMLLRNEALKAALSTPGARRSLSLELPLLVKSAGEGSLTIVEIPEGALEQALKLMFCDPTP